MAEIIIPLDITNPVAFFGANDANVDVIRKKFPALKIIARGNEMKILGEDDLAFQCKLFIENLAYEYDKNGILTPVDDSPVFQANGNKTNGNASNVLVYGPNGIVVKARSPKQIRMVEACADLMRLVAGVADVHHVHIRYLNEHDYALEAHIVPQNIADTETVKAAIKTRLADLRIAHSTLEFENKPCDVHHCGEIQKA